MSGRCERQRGWTVHELAVGPDFACARYPGGNIHCAGRNVVGQLGRSTPPPTEDAGALLFPPGPTTIHAAKSIGVGSAHACALAGEGAWCWGANDRGQLGRTDFKNSAMAKAVLNLPDVQILAVGGSHNCGLKANGVVGCWGANDAGQLGDGSRERRNVLVGVRGLTGKIKQLALGKSHSCALREDGSVSCWGAGNPNGELTAIAGLGKVDELAAATTGTCARTGTMVRCFGGAWGEKPSEKKGLAAKRIVSSNTSGDLVCAEKPAGAIECFTPKDSRVIADMAIPEGGTLGLAVADGAVCSFAGEGPPRCETLHPLRETIEQF